MPLQRLGPITLLGLSPRANSLSTGSLTAPPTSATTGSSGGDVAGPRPYGWNFPRTEATPARQASESPLTHHGLLPTMPRETVESNSEALFAPIPEDIRQNLEQLFLGAPPASRSPHLGSPYQSPSSSDEDEDEPWHNRPAVPATPQNEFVRDPLDDVEGDGRDSPESDEDPLANINALSRAVSEESDHDRPVTSPHSDGKVDYRGDNTISTWESLSPPPGFVLASAPSDPNPQTPRRTTGGLPTRQELEDSGMQAIVDFLNSDNIQQPGDNSHEHPADDVYGDPRQSFYVHPGGNKTPAPGTGDQGYDTTMEPEDIPPIIDPQPLQQTNAGSDDNIDLQLLQQTDSGFDNVVDSQLQDFATPPHTEFDDLPSARDSGPDLLDSADFLGAAIPQAGYSDDIFDSNSNYRESDFPQQADPDIAMEYQRISGLDSAQPTVRSDLPLEQRKDDGGDILMTDALEIETVAANGPPDALLIPTSRPANELPSDHTGGPGPLSPGSSGSTSNLDGNSSPEAVMSPRQQDQSISGLVQGLGSLEIQGSNQTGSSAVRDGHDEGPTDSLHTSDGQAFAPAPVIVQLDQQQLYEALSSDPQPRTTPSTIESQDAGRVKAIYAAEASDDGQRISTSPLRTRTPSPGRTSTSPSRNRSPSPRRPNISPLTNSPSLLVTIPEDLPSITVTSPQSGRWADEDDTKYWAAENQKLHIDLTTANTSQSMESDASVAENPASIPEPVIPSPQTPVREQSPPHDDLALLSPEVDPDTGLTRAEAIAVADKWEVEPTLRRIRSELKNRDGDSSGVVDRIPESPSSVIERQQHKITRTRQQRDYFKERLDYLTTLGNKNFLTRMQAAQDHIDKQQARIDELKGLLAAEEEANDKLADANDDLEQAVHDSRSRLQKSEDENATLRKQLSAAQKQLEEGKPKSSSSVDPGRESSALDGLVQDGPAQNSHEQSTTQPQDSPDAQSAPSDALAQNDAELQSTKTSLSECREHGRRLEAKSRKHKKALIDCQMHCKKLQKDLDDRMTSDRPIPRFPPFGLLERLRPRTTFRFPDEWHSKVATGLLAVMDNRDDSTAESSTTSSQQLQDVLKIPFVMHQDFLSRLTKAGFKFRAHRVFQVIERFAHQSGLENVQIMYLARRFDQSQPPPLGPCEPDQESRMVTKLLEEIIDLKVRLLGAGDKLASWEAGAVSRGVQTDEDGEESQLLQDQLAEKRAAHLQTRQAKQANDNKFDDSTKKTQKLLQESNATKSNLEEENAKLQREVRKLTEEREEKNRVAQQDSPLQISTSDRANQTAAAGNARILANRPSPRSGTTYKRSNQDPWSPFRQTSDAQRAWLNAMIPDDDPANPGQSMARWRKFERTAEAKSQARERKWNDSNLEWARLKEAYGYRFGTTAGAQRTYTRDEWGRKTREWTQLGERDERRLRREQEA